jgi:phage baseplate assembly protein W
MDGFYYKIPLQLKNALEGIDLETHDLRHSISKNLELMIMTRFGEHRCDQTYGCEIWDLDFELIVSQRLWEEKLRKSMLATMNTHEPRLTNIDLSIAITDFEKRNPFQQSTEIKKRVDILILGTIQKTGKEFRLNTSLFLSPLSVD